MLDAVIDTSDDVEARKSDEFTLKTFVKSLNMSKCANGPSGLLIFDICTIVRKAKIRKTLGTSADFWGSKRAITTIDLVSRVVKTGVGSPRRRGRGG